MKNSLIRKLTTCIVLLISSIYGTAQSLPTHVIEAYEDDGWLYMVDNTFLYSERYNSTGDPEVLSLKIILGDPNAYLFLNKYDCKNNRMMLIAFKRYQNKPLIEKEHYLFENKLEWQYPLKTSLGDIMMRTACEKFE